MIKSRDDLKNEITERLNTANKQLEVMGEEGDVGGYINIVYGISKGYEQAIDLIDQWEKNDLTNMSSDDMMKGK